MRLCQFPLFRLVPFGLATPVPSRVPGAWARAWPLVLVLGVACALPTQAWSGERADHDEAREALVRGQVMPLKQVLEQLARQRPGGHILEVELESKRGRWVYEIKQMEPGGQLVKLKLDARTGEVLNDPPPRRTSPRPPAVPLSGPQGTP